MSDKRPDVLGLPKGWTKEEVIRQNGMSRGKTDIYYYRYGNLSDKMGIFSELFLELPAINTAFITSPSGKKFRSKPDLQRELGPSYDLTYFHYRAGKFMTDKIRSSQKQRSLGRVSSLIGMRLGINYKKQTKLTFNRTCQSEGSQKICT